MAKSASSLRRVFQYLENPVPHIRDAQEAATRVVHLQTELLALKAESSVAKQGKRMALRAAAAFSAMLAIAFCVAWFTVFLHETGTQANTLAIFSLIFFIAISAVLTILATRKETQL